MATKYENPSPDDRMKLQDSHADSRASEWQKSKSDPLGGLLGPGSPKFQSDTRSHIERRQVSDRRQTIRFEDDRRQKPRRAEDQVWRFT